MTFTFARRADFTWLCTIMLRGEALALRCAERQERLAPDGPLRRQLAAQRRHEHLHVTSFQSVLALLPRYRGLEHDRALRLLDAYERKLDDALRRGDLVESLLGLQVILEGAAAAVLRQLDLSVQSGKAPLQPARSMLIAHEDGHRLLGERAVSSALSVGHKAERLQEAAQEYGQVARDILIACRAPLAGFGVGPATHDPLAALPAALRPRPPPSLSAP